MNAMTYKGYTARIEYDERDNIFAGRILGIRTIISFHGETVAELREEFELQLRTIWPIAKNKAYIPRNPLPASCCCAFPQRFMAVRSLPRRQLARA